MNIKYIAAEIHLGRIPEMSPVQTLFQTTNFVLELICMLSNFPGQKWTNSNTPISFLVVRSQGTFPVGTTLQTTNFPLSFTPVLHNDECKRILFSLFYFFYLSPIRSAISYPFFVCTFSFLRLQCLQEGREGFTSRANVSSHFQLFFFFITHFLLTIICNFFPIIQIIYISSVYINTLGLLLFPLFCLFTNLNLPPIYELLSLFCSC